MTDLKLQVGQVKYNRVPAKYCLTDSFSYSCKLPCINENECRVSAYFVLTRTGIQVSAGYSWDGASGPTIDSDNSIRAGLVHDVLYQAIREGRLPESYRKRADKIFRRILKEDGMTWVRRWAWYLAVRAFGGPNAVCKVV